MLLQRLLVKYFSWISPNPHIPGIQLPVYVLTLLSLFYLNSFNYLWMILIGWTLFSGLGINTSYHRLLSHHSFTCSKLTSYIITLFGALGAQGSPVFWVALHRAHHAYTDTEKDLHSPIHGKWHAYLGWHDKMRRSDINLLLAKDIVRDPFYNFLSKYYFEIVWSITGLAFLISPALGFFGFIVPMCLSIHEESLINCFCHLKNYGYRSFETRDNSVNIWWMGFLFWGLGYHNNHHRYPNEADYCRKWWEFDFSSKIFVPLLKKM
jgi:fatty-acid desaturase